MTKFPTIMRVVAGALQRDDGLWLMHQRPSGKHHEGLWEFPGGKLEATESPQEALCRELDEELGILIADDSLRLVASACEGASNNADPIVIELYTVFGWRGEPKALEGGKIAWLTPEEALSLDLAPLDIVLAGKLFCDLV